MKASEAFDESQPLPRSALDALGYLDGKDETIRVMTIERNLLAAALKAVVAANDTIDGAVGEIQQQVGDEAATLARYILNNP